MSSGVSSLLYKSWYSASFTTPRQQEALAGWMNRGAYLNVPRPDADHVSGGSSFRGGSTFFAPRRHITNARSRKKRMTTAATAAHRPGLSDGVPSGGGETVLTVNVSTWDALFPLMSLAQTVTVYVPACV